MLLLPSQSLNEVFSHLQYRDINSQKNGLLMSLPLKVVLSVLLLFFSYAKISVNSLFNKKQCLDLDYIAQNHEHRKQSYLHDYGLFASFKHVAIASLPDKIDDDATRYK